MKFNKMTRGLFTLFLVYSHAQYASTSSDVKHTIQYVIAHPLKSLVSGCKIGAKGLVTLYAGYYALLKAGKVFKYFGDGNASLRISALKIPFKTSLMCAGLTFVAYEGFNSLVADIKELK
jgi:hypothetical protein